MNIRVKFLRTVVCWLCVQTLSQHTKFGFEGLEIETPTGNHYNPFESKVFIRSSEHLRTFRQRLDIFRKLSEIFGSGCYVFGNPSNDEMKSHTFDSEKVGRYIIASKRCATKLTNQFQWIRTLLKHLHNFHSGYGNSCLGHWQQPFTGPPPLGRSHYTVEHLIIFISWCILYVF